MTPPMQDEEPMAPGMISGVQQAPEPEDMAEPGEPPEGTPQDMTEDRAEGEMEGGGVEVIEQAQESLKQHVPPQFAQATQRFVLAGMRVMFHPKTHELVMRELTREEGPIERRVAMGVAALVSILQQRTKGPVQQPALVAAANILLMEALKFLAQGGQIDATPDLVSNATSELSAYLMQKFGLDTPEKVREAQQVMVRGASGEPMPPEARPPEPQAPPQAAGGGGGMIERMMGA